MRTCTDIQPQLSSFVDDALTGDAREDVVAHLVDCAACAALAADLGSIRTAAGELAPIDPPARVWSAIAERIRLAPAPIARAPAPRSTTSRSLQPWLAVAAAVVAMVLGAYGVSRLHSPVRPASATSQEHTVVTGTPETPLPDATTSYDTAIAALEAAARRPGGQIDPAVAATLATNLAAIDRAIVESRTALVSSPDSAPARESLIDSLQRKVAVLQQSVALATDAQ